MLNLRNLLANGGVKAMEQRNNEKAALLYKEIDENPAFRELLKSKTVLI
jgi:phosphoserine aminotransferase